MPGVIRQGDKNVLGGIATTGITTVLVNGQPIVVDGTRVSPHHKKHYTASTRGGVSSVVAGGKPVNVIGNTDTCGHGRQQGSSDVTVG